MFFKQRFKKKINSVVQSDGTLIVDDSVYALLANLDNYDAATNTIKVNGFTVKVVCDNTGIVDTKTHNMYFVKKPKNPDTNSSILYSHYLPSITTKPIAQKQKVSYTFNKKELYKTNIHDLRVTPNTVSFYVSFLKDKLCEESSLYAIGTSERQITIKTVRNPDDSFGFRSFTLSVEAGLPNAMAEIKSLKIPDSYNCNSDLLGYMHGIYRENKNDVYKVIIDLNNGNLESYEATAK